MRAFVLMALVAGGFAVKLPESCHQPSAERAVIGACFLDGAAADVADLEPGEFDDPRLRVTFAAIRRLRAEGKPVDTLLVSDLVPDAARALLPECVSEVPTADNVAFYAALIRDAALKRRLLSLRDLLSAETTGRETLEAAWRELSAISTRPEGDMALVASVALSAALRAGEIADERRSGGSGRQRVPTGLRDLDEVLGGGLPVGVVSVEGGRPGTGKSSLARSIAFAAAAAGHGAHVFSLEDSADVYGDRVIADLGEVELGRVRGGGIDVHEGARLIDAAGRVQDLPWGLDSRAGLSSAQVAMAVRRHKRELATRLVVVDYVQLMHEPAAGPRKIDQVGAALKGLVRLAREENVAVLVISQLNRGSARENRRPQLHDLRESGELEQDARLVLFTHHVLDAAGSKTGQAEIYVAKNTNGQGDVSVDVRWDAPRARYLDRFSVTR